MSHLLTSWNCLQAILRKLARAWLLVALGLLAGHAKGQSISESFSNPDLTKPPGWSGTRADFDVSGGWLNLNAKSPGFFWLSTPIALQDTAIWQVRVWCGLSPSTQNFAQLILSADSADMTTAYTGWHIQIGANSSADGLELYRVLKGRRRLIGSVAQGLVGKPFNYPFKITRSTSGSWAFFADTAGRGLVPLGILADTAGLAGQFFGLGAGCTTNFRSFFWHWDNVYVEAGPTQTSKQTLNGVACAGKRIWVLVPKGVHPTAANQVSGVGQSVKPLFTKGEDGRYTALISPFFPQPADSDSARRLSLVVSGWQDSTGLPLLPQSFACKCLPEAAQLVLSEVKVGNGGPPGQPLLPEFVEVHNPYTYKVWQEGAEIGNAQPSYKPLVSDSLGGGTYRVYTTPSSLAAFRAAGDSAAIGVTLPYIPDNGGKVVLRLLGQGVDSLVYTPSFWVRTADIQTLSLERGPICLPNLGWYPSRAGLGSTPGQPSGYNWASDTSLVPSISSIIYTKGIGVFVRFTPKPIRLLPLDSLSLVWQPALMGGKWQWQDSVLVYTGNLTLDSNLTYSLAISGLRGCGGATVPRYGKLRTELPSGPRVLVLNEVLYDPITGCLPFIEIKNITNRWVPLAGLGLVNVNYPQADTVFLGSKTPPIEPGGYRWLARAPQTLQLVYPKAVATAFLPTRLPSLQAGSTVHLITGTGDEIDALTYGPTLHSVGISNTTGVSLERVSDKVVTSVRENWQSAAGQAGAPAATPGFANSQSASAGAGGSFSATPQAFSPNSDGYQDWTLLEATELPPGAQARLTVFDAAGQVIRRLATQATTGPTFTSLWDGRNDNGERAGAGIYVVLAEFYHPSHLLAPRKTLVGVQP